jgi:hypothetical protein
VYAPNWALQSWSPGAAYQLVASTKSCEKRCNCYFRP